MQSDHSKTHKCAHCTRWLQSLWCATIFSCPLVHTWLCKVSCFLFHRPANKSSSLMLKWSSENVIICMKTKKQWRSWILHHSHKTMSMQIQLNWPRFKGHYPYKHEDETQRPQLMALPVPEYIGSGSDSTCKLIKCVGHLLAGLRVSCKQSRASGQLPYLTLHTTTSPVWGG